MIWRVQLRMAVAFRAVLLTCVCGVLTCFSAPAIPSITNGLAHFWPNLWNARDEVSGAEGTIMGILPGITNGVPDEIEFCDQSGWVQLPADLPNSKEFTVAVWVRPAAPIRQGAVVLALHCGQQRWWLQHREGATNRFHTPGRDEPGIELHLPYGEWTQVAISKRDSGTIEVWKNGVLAGEGDLQLPGNMPLDLSSAGNSVKGDTQWLGAMSELRVFDRALSAEELRELHAVGFRRHVAQETRPRRLATRQTDSVEWSTNYTRSNREKLTFHRYTSEDGLPANIIQCLHQSRDGYLWVGTDEGLARFDGRRFRSWTAQNEPALASVENDIISLCEAADGSLWAGGYGGLLRIRGSQITAFTNLLEGLVIQVAPAESNTIWMAGFRMDGNDRGPCAVRRFHPDTQKTSDHVVVPGHVRRFVPTQEGLWMATEEPEQLLFWNRSSIAPEVAAKISGPGFKVELRGEAAVPGLRAQGWRDPADPSHACLELRAGEDGPLFHWLSPARNAAASANRWSLPGNPAGWIGGVSGLARRVQEGIEQIVFPEGSTPREVTCVTRNREGDVWAGTDGDGLYLVREKLVQVFTTDHGLGGNDIRSVVASRSGQVVVSGPAGVYQLHSGRWNQMALAPQPALSVTAIAEDPSGIFWGGFQHLGSDALFRFDTTNSSRFVVPGMVWKHPTTMAVSPGGTIWIGCEFGITWINSPNAHLNGMPGEPSRVPHGRLKAGEELPLVRLLKILPDRGDSVWVGTLGKGLLRVTTHKVEVLSSQDGLPFAACSPALLDDTGALWAVTYEAIVRYSNGRFQVADKSHGVPEDRLLDIIEDDEGYFWLPGQRGIHRLKRSELEAIMDGRGKRVRSLTLGVRDGLLTPECTALHYPITAKTSDGRIWVATRRGVASFNPREVHINTLPLPAMIEHVVAGRKQTFIAAEAKTGKPVLLPPGSGHRLEIHFAATSLVAADRVKFRYRLQGYDPDWSNESDLRQAFYTNLRPGRYTFQVQACNPHGIWNQDATTMAVVIAPYFWETPWFYGLVALVTGTALLLAHRQRLGVLRRLQELDHQQNLLGERSRIAADMHDDLGAALTQIAILGEVAKNQLNDPNRARTVLTRISESAREVTARMSDLVWATNPRNDTLDNLVAYLREHLARKLEEANIRARLVFPEDPEALHLSATFRRNVLLTVKEALNNALKHASASEITVELNVETGFLIIRVQDNGKGFDSSTSARFGNGLLNMRRRIEDLGGTFHISAVPGEGTSVRMRVPIQQRGGPRN